MCRILEQDILEIILLLFPNPHLMLILNHLSCLSSEQFQEIFKILSNSLDIFENIGNRTLWDQFFQLISASKLTQIVTTLFIRLSLESSLERDDLERFRSQMSRLKTFVNSQIYESLEINDEYSFSQHLASDSYFSNIQDWFKTKLPFSIS